MRTIKLFILTSIMIVVFSCEKSNNDNSLNETTISNIYFTGCTDSLKTLDADSTCIAIISNEENFLSFNHKGAEFCCESEIVDIKFEISGDSIIIEEIDKGPFTYCFCEHDISFKIGPLEYGNYKVKIIESENSYLRDTIMLELSHTKNTNYLHCK